MKFGLNLFSMLYLLPANAVHFSDSDENKIPFSTQDASTFDVLLDVHGLKPGRLFLLIMTTQGSFRVKL
jgi:hypothetical protein